MKTFIWQWGEHIPWQLRRNQVPFPHSPLENFRIVVEKADHRVAKEAPGTTIGIEFLPDTLTKTNLFSQHVELLFDSTVHRPFDEILLQAQVDDGHWQDRQDRGSGSGWHVAVSFREEGGNSKGDGLELRLLQHI